MDIPAATRFVVLVVVLGHPFQLLRLVRRQSLLQITGFVVVVELRRRIVQSFELLLLLLDDGRTLSRENRLLVVIVGMRRVQQSIERLLLRLNIVGSAVAVHLIVLLNVMLLRLYGTELTWITRCPVICRMTVVV